MLLAIIEKGLFLNRGRRPGQPPGATPGPKHAEWIDPLTLSVADGALRPAGQSNYWRSSDWL